MENYINILKILPQELEIWKRSLQILELNTNNSQNFIKLDECQGFSVYKI